MKKQFIFYFIAFFCSIVQSNAQVPIYEIDSLVNGIRLEVKAIDKPDLFKVKLDHEGYHPGNYEGYYEWQFDLYYDADGNIKKTITLYSYDDASCITYYNNTGVAIFTSYYIAGMNGLESSERYLDGEGELLYVYHVSRDDWCLPQAVELISSERIIRRASPIATVPNVGNEFYDNVRSIDDFKKVYLDIFDSEDHRHGGEFPIPPENMKQRVRFTMPEKGDITSLTQNGVVVYKKTTPESLILFTLDIRRDIEIIDRQGDWYKIAMKACGGDTLEGYIQGEYLAPIERAVKE